MTDRIKNAKLFVIAFLVVILSGSALFTVKHNSNSYRSSVVKEYKTGKDNVDFGKSFQLKRISSSDLIIGEELHIIDSNSFLYNHIRTASILKKIGKNSLDSEIKIEPQLSINHLYNEQGGNLSATSNYYRVMMELQNEFISEKSLDSSVIRTITNPIIIKEDGDVVYVRDTIYFIDKNTDELVNILNVNSKYNHKEDVILYMDTESVSKSTVKKVQNLLKESLEDYDKVYENLPQIIEIIGEEAANNIVSIKIYSENFVLVAISEDNEQKLLLVDYENKTLKEM